MKKKYLSLALALVMCLTLLPMTALAASSPVQDCEPPIIADLAVYYQDEAKTNVGLTFTFTLTDKTKALFAQYPTEKVYFYGEIAVDGGDWKSLSPYGIEETAEGVLAVEGQTLETYGGGFTAESEIKFRARFAGHDSDGWYWTGEYSNVLTLNEKVDLNASEWALEELAAADELGLIPEVLQGADLTQDITRAEFAAVAVKAYEALSGTAAIPIVNNPFTDCNDVEVLKAYNIGAVNGTSATTFDPDELLNREQAATMLTRVFKRITLAGWTLATDGQFSLTYTKPAAFADDADISAWAKDSVYFMAANGIINGVGNNKFAPKNVTTEEQATGYANATREQALLIAVRMVQNLKQD